MQKQRLVIIGANSYLGARLFFDLGADSEVVGTYHSFQLSPHFQQLDITNADEVMAFFTRIKPDVIIQTANNASGGWCQAHPQEALQLNQESTMHIVAAANAVQAKLVYISSFAAIDPSDIYGQTKAASEKTAEHTTVGWSILRPSLILGMSPNQKNDRPHNRLLKNITERTPAIYDTSWQFTPTYIGHISQVITGVIEMQKWNTIIPISIQEATNRYDVAKDILAKFDISVEARDEKSSLALQVQPTTFFSEFGIPEMNYQQMIETVVSEIKNREKFVI
jgi:dTDP-4-dehydrorhamnose reductase